MDRGLEREQLDSFRYPYQQYRLAVDNLGPGPLLRLSVPYVLKVLDVDSESGELVTPDHYQQVEGTFDLFHVPAGGSRQSSVGIETTHFPAFEIQLGEPEVLGLGGQRYDSAWTDIGEEYRKVGGNNSVIWRSLRQSVWGALRPTSIDVALTGPIQRYGDIAAIHLKVTATNRDGARMSGGAAIAVVSENGTPSLSGHRVALGAQAVLEVPNVSAGTYFLNVSVGRLAESIPLQIP